MNITIRTDSSIMIGTGHVMRCLTLADALREKGAEITFICSELEGNINDLIKKKAYQVGNLPVPVDSSNNRVSLNYNSFPWKHDAEQTLKALHSSGSKHDLLIVDHYSLDYRWEGILNPFVKNLMAIDDLADRSHSCDILLDQNIQETSGRYELLVPNNCTMLLGPQFAMLRPDFAEFRRKTSVRGGQINNILVFFGGTDVINETEKTIHAINSLARKNFSITVIVGKNNPHKARIERLCNQSSGFNYNCQVNNMAEIMSTADLGIGAGGTSTWERCSVGLPAIIISVADNQISIANSIHKEKAQIYLGHYSEVTSEDICGTIRKLQESPELIKELSANSVNITDAMGTEKVIQTIFSRDH